MRKLLRKTLMVMLLGSLLLGLAAPASARERGSYTGGAFSLDAFTGGYQFDEKQKLDLRSYYGLRAGYYFTKRVGMEAMFGYVPTETQSMLVADRDVRVYRYGLDVQYYFNPDGIIVPFVQAGIGGTQIDFPDEWKNRGRGMFDYGVGLKYFLSDKVALRGDLKQSLFKDGGDARTNLEYTIGLSMLFGTEKKNVPAVRDRRAPEVICTNPGTNVTGWAVDKNVTAVFSEDMDRDTIDSSTFTLMKGTTPVSGKVSFAGTTATFDPSSEFEKGTTYTAKIVAGVKDLSGNALEHSYEWNFTTIPSPPVPKAVIPVLISLEDAHFDFNSAELSENGKTILNYNAKILKENPTMKIRVAGYTSASGTKEFNQSLSEKRATAVKNYLVKEGGVSEARLTKIGYGETRPAEYEPVPQDIYSEAAKANQRVLFEVIVK